MVVGVLALLSGALLLPGCTTVTHQPVAPWLRLTRLEATEVLPHGMFTLGERAMRAEMRIGDAWVELFNRDSLLLGQERGYGLAGWRLSADRALVVRGLENTSPRVYCLVTKGQQAVLPLLAGTWDGLPSADRQRLIAVDLSEKGRVTVNTIGLPGPATQRRLKLAPGSWWRLVGLDAQDRPVLVDWGNAHGVVHRIAVVGDTVVLHDRFDPTKLEPSQPTAAFGGGWQSFPEFMSTMAAAMTAKK